MVCCHYPERQRCKLSILATKGGWSFAYFVFGKKKKCPFFKESKAFPIDLRLISPFVCIQLYNAFESKN